MDILNTFKYISPKCRLPDKDSVMSIKCLQRTKKKPSLLINKYINQSTLYKRETI